MAKLTQDRAFAENYFNFLANSNSSCSSSQTSDPLNQYQFYKNDILDPAEQRILLNSFDQLKGHAQHLQSLANLTKVSIQQCAPQLRAGFNFLCYGLGRKQNLLDVLIPEIFDDFNIFKVSGFSEAALNLGPMAFFNAFLNSIQISLFPSLKFDSPNSSSKASITSKCQILCKEFKKSTQTSKTLLLLHQLDSTAFRSPVIFDCLMNFVNSGRVSIIASIDNPGIVNLFSESRFEQFNWIWMDCTTLQPYSEELNRFALDACTNSAAKQTPRAAVIVLQSLTSNSRSIFKLLATFQLSSNESQVSAHIDSLEYDEDQNSNVQINNINTNSCCKEYIGMSYHGLFQKCQENFVVTAEANFRTQLTEFTDHDLFKSTEGRDGSIMFFIPFYHPELRQIIQDL